MPKIPDLFTKSIGKGRIILTILAIPIGCDLQVSIFGGDAHIGAVALGANNASTVLSASGHREKDMAKAMAAVLARRLKRNVAVCAGIHYDHITASEIAVVEDLAAELTEAVCDHFTGRRPMLTIHQLNEFEEYIRSGKLEAAFRQAGEYERGEILELLEKLMDVAELADEAATRLIFRGIPVSGYTGASGSKNNEPDGKGKADN